MTAALLPDGQPESSENSALALLVTVTVTYNPDPDVLAAQLSQLPRMAFKLIVDNATRPDLRPAIRSIACVHGAILLQNEKNEGLAAALNQGARHAGNLNPSAKYLLLLDQDSEPGEGNVERLIIHIGQLEVSTGIACCVGPRLVDVTTGLEYGFHQQRGWRWARIFPPTHAQAPVPVANLNGSGTLVPLALFDALGGLEEDFFIDHIDTEWAFRVLAAGYGLYGIPDVVFRHRMGEKGLRFWFLGWRVWPDRSPMRHYYLFRNAVRLMRRGYVPRVWKAWAAPKLVITFFVHLLFDRNRFAQARCMVEGVRAALRSEKKYDADVHKDAE